jgi:Fe2+ transport system protein FeoA
MSSRSSDAVPLPLTDPSRPVVCVEVVAGHRLRQRLADLGIVPGTELNVVRPHASGGPLVVEVRGSRLALGQGMAHGILVVPAEPGGGVME